MVEVEKEEQAEKVFPSLILIFQKTLPLVLAPVPHHRHIDNLRCCLLNYVCLSRAMRFELTLLCELLLQLGVDRQLFNDAAGRTPQETGKTGRR